MASDPQAPATTHWPSLHQLILFVAGKPEHPADLDQAEARTSEPDTWLWMELVNPSQGEIDALVQRFKLHQQTVHHAVQTQQRPRFNRLGGLATLVLHPVSYDDREEQVRLGQISLLLGPTHLITLVTGPDIGGVGDARDRLLAAPRLAALGPKAGCYAVLDDVVDDFQPTADGLEHDIDEIDDSLDQADPQVATRIYRLSRQVTALLGAVSPLEACITQVRKSLVRTDVDLLEDSDPIHGDPQAHRTALLDALFAEVSTHVLRIEDRASGMRNTLTNALSLASTLAAQRATDISLVQNDQTKKVSSWAAIFAVPAVISGIFGMNFVHFPGLAWQYGFVGSMVLMVVLCLILYWVFTHHDWL